MGRQVKRVPLDFDWPINETWKGYLNPHPHADQCEACQGSGYSPEAKIMADEWYGQAPFLPALTGSIPFMAEHECVKRMAERNVSSNEPFYKQFHFTTVRETAVLCEAYRLALLFNKSWSHHLSQEDVDALTDAGRLMEFTLNGYRPTADEVNEWSLFGFGHDAINQWICIKARCRREGVPHLCKKCDGDGHVWASDDAKTLYESWERQDPPEGPGYQIWQTVSEGGPVSPVFANPGDLASWMVNNDDSATEGTAYKQWLKFINGPGVAPSGILVNGRYKNGVAAVADQ